MTIRNIESFDWLATADLAKKYTITAGVSIGAYGRYSTNGLRISGNSTSISLVLDNQATWIVGFAFTHASLPNAQPFVSLYDVGNPQLDLRINNNGTISVTRAGTVLGTSANSILAGQSYFIELKATIGNTVAAGGVVLKVNGVEWWSNTGNIDTQATANAYANRVYIQSGAGLTLDIDDWYIEDGTDGTATQGEAFNDFLGDGKIIALFPSSAGTYSGGTPSGAATVRECVDETSNDGDTTYVSMAASDKWSVNCQNLDAAIGGTVRAYQVDVVTRKDDAGVVTERIIEKSGATERIGTSASLANTFGTITQIRGNKVAGGALTIAEINALEIGMERTA